MLVNNILIKQTWLLCSLVAKKKNEGLGQEFILPLMH